MEQTGSTLFQTSAGLFLDSTKSPKATSNDTSQQLLNTFLALNGLQFLSILYLGYLRRVRRRSSPPRSHHRERTDSSCLLSGGCQNCDLCSPETQPLIQAEAEEEIEVCTDAELRRGKWMVGICVALFLSAWGLFMSTAWLKLGRSR